MADPRFDAVERAQLSDLLDELGPEAPTLLAPWTTRDLAAHLVLREHDSRPAPGLSCPVRGSAGSTPKKGARAEGFYVARRDVPVGTAARVLPHRMGCACC